MVNGGLRIKFNLKIFKRNIWRVFYVKEVEELEDLDLEFRDRRIIELKKEKKVNRY